MSNEPIIFVDMDGVLTNFVELACFVHNKDYFSVLDTFHKHGHDHDMLYSVFNLPVEDFWVVIDKWDHDRGFWRNLEPYLWTHTLLARLSRYGRVILCSTPSKDQDCCSGKVEWIYKYLGEETEYIFIRDKPLLAGPGRILIDDRLETILRWQAKGGNGILFPQPWNPNRDKLDDRISYVMGHFEL